MAYSITGKLYFVSPIRNYTTTFRKRDFVIKIDRQYSDKEWSEYIKFQLINQHILIIEGYDIGTTITVHFDIKGTMKEFEGREVFFTNLVAWKIESEEDNGPRPPDSEESERTPGVNWTNLAELEYDDLPF